MLYAVSEAIFTRLSKISVNKEIFNDVVPKYQIALSGHEHVFRFQQTNEEKKKEKEISKFIWFNLKI